MLGLADDDDSLRFERLHERIGNLLGEPLLNLKAPREQIDDARDLGQADDVAAGKVADV